MSNGASELVHVNRESSQTPLEGVGCPGFVASPGAASSSGGVSSLSPLRIRSYCESDWPTVLGWWVESKETPPLPTMMPTESSFVAEVSGVLAMAVTLYLTNTPDIAYVENFVWSPVLRGVARKQTARVLLDHMAKFARSRGYMRLICMSEKESLMRWYQELGFHPTLSGVTAFVRST